MNKFKIGDKVVVIRDDSEFHLIDKTGYIHEIVNAQYKYKVSLYNEKTYYFFQEDELELIVPYINERKLRKALGLE